MTTSHPNPSETEPSFMKLRPRPTNNPTPPPPPKPPRTLAIVTAAYFLVIILAIWVQVQFCFGIGPTISSCPASTPFGEVVGKTLFIFAFIIFTLIDPMSSGIHASASSSSTAYLAILAILIFLFILPVALVATTIKKYCQYYRQQHTPSPSSTQTTPSKPPKTARDIIIAFLISLPLAVTALAFIITSAAAPTLQYARVLATVFSIATFAIPFTLIIRALIKQQTYKKPTPDQPTNQARKETL